MRERERERGKIVPFRATQPNATNSMIQPEQTNKTLLITSINRNKITNQRISIRIA